MMQAEKNMIIILYSPASYTHSTHFSELLLLNEVWDEMLINYWLLKKFPLNAPPDDLHPKSTALSLVISNWYKLPIAAHLIGGYLLRMQFPGIATSLLKDPRLLAFISLPLMQQNIKYRTTNYSDTHSLGAAFILSQMPELAPALRQRLLMCFPADIYLPDLCLHKTRNHFNLLKMAFSYAHCYYE